ncbi:hypothetical protein [Streptomyces torulosus]|uniref:hypothetical protein n=1 Tax=Streptomyces torulosus TaxID=68276 RepID=UPI0012FEF11E|nr:hypothetical protein [Streptomyces torulosus]
MPARDHAAEDSSVAPSPQIAASPSSNDQLAILVEKGKIFQRALSLLVGGGVDLTLMLTQHETWMQGAWHAAATVGVLNTLVIVSEKVRVVVS